MAHKRKNTAAPSIAQLAGELSARRDSAKPGGTVLLGAGASVTSSIQTWGPLAKDICTNLLAIDTTGKDPASALVDYLYDWSNPAGMRQSIFQKYLQHRLPSIGYSHLAQLVKDGFITTILTTNWDTLLEKALVRAMSVDAVKVFIRGEVDDDTIASLLATRYREHRPSVVKLHGDIHSGVLMLGDEETRRFGERLDSVLQDCLSGTSFVVGQSARDIDILATLLSGRRDTGALYYVRYADDGDNSVAELLARAQAKIVSGRQKSILADGQDVDIGAFDAFFTQLDLAIQRLLTTGRRKHLKDAEASIIQKEATGIGYINYSRITELVESFTVQVKQVRPDLILFVEDPSAPGGVELRRRMMPIMKANGIDIPSETIRVQGYGGSRTFRRSIGSDLSQLPLDDTARTVLILDSITFSGNTLEIARKAVKDAFPNVTVRLGVLVISKQLHDEQEDLRKKHLHKAFMFQTVTDRYEIFFPWGVTQTTAAISRSFVGAAEDEGRQVRIERRPWGTIEILANQEMTSVRLLTIEAQRRLSFQRHLCRDELFVALDDNIGLDICAEDIDREASQYDERVKSLILEKGDYVLVPRGVWHRTKASMDRVRLLEVAFELYDQDNDIERRWDDYDRSHIDGST